MSQSGVLKKWLDNKNYGFITPDGSDQDLFVHRSQFIGLTDESGLQEGQPVVFNQISDEKGRIRAENVSGPSGNLVLVGRTPQNPFGRVRGRGFGRGGRGRGGRGRGFESRPFDGNCNSCGAQGHRSRECPTNPQGPVDGQYGRSNFRSNSPSGGYDDNRGRGGRYPSAFSRGRRGGRGGRDGDYNGRGRGRFGGSGGFGDQGNRGGFGDGGDRGRGRGRGRGRRGGGFRGGFSDRGGRGGDSGRGGFSSPSPQYGGNPFARPNYNSSDAPQGRFDAGGRGMNSGPFANNRQPGRGGSFPGQRFGSPDGQRGGFGGRF